MSHKAPFATSQPATDVCCFVCVSGEIWADRASRVEPVAVPPVGVSLLVTHVNIRSSCLTCCKPS